MQPWNNAAKIAFRICFIFYLIMCIPFSKEWYDRLFAVHWNALHYRDIYDITRFMPVIIKFENSSWNLMGYTDWLLILAISVIGGLIFSYVDRKRSSYYALNYWLMVLIRYRAAIGIIGFGFLKIFPVQMPFPSLAMLNTDFGQYSAQKLYWVSVGIVPWYQSFAGVFEIGAGILLLFRKTTVYGAILLFAAMADIVYVNFSYDGNVHIYSSYFVILAAYLLAYDLPYFHAFFIKERYVIPYHYYPSFQEKWQQYLRAGLKSALLFLFVGVTAYLQLMNFWYDPYKQPSLKGVPVLRGNYNVTFFSINNKEIAYNPFDTIRWQHVTFEKWSTLTFSTNQPQNLDLSNGVALPMRDINRTFELTGMAGRKTYFYYEADTAQQVLHLHNKNPLNKKASITSNSFYLAGGRKHIVHDTITVIPDVIRKEINGIDERARSWRRQKHILLEYANAQPGEDMTLHYATKDGSRIIMTGVTRSRDSLYIVLDKVEKHYLLTESSLNAGNY
ncbi:hypothetical protein [Chitinophaga ginsengisoli]|uniref:DoxX-like protein n=1 Tax=Chitinophaga ginsengisoli TaxID=363837 RepID=A0A2P8GQC5_9BACT|nr:hypothetical protein [Chitinophaga ginsengisoli]PSL36163.1 hypothetical protein CLV42_101932 [Chitinophaga ginsengisoli]